MLMTRTNSTEKISDNEQGAGLTKNNGSVTFCCFKLSETINWIIELEQGDWQSLAGSQIQE